MRAYRVLLAVLACAVIAPAAAEAQVAVRVTHRGVLGIMTEVTRTPGAAAEYRVIRDVVPDSPADRAGVLKGDTLLSINGRAATDGGMRPQFEPGDTVVLRVRRDGRERDIRVVAGERSTHFESITLEMLPDSIMKHMAVIMENVRAELDTLKIPRGVRIERLPGDSVILFRFGDDSTRVFRFDHPRMRIEMDSLRLQLRDIGEHSRFLADSLRGHVFRSDSLREHVFRSVDGRFYQFGDSVHIMRPGEIFATGMTTGLRSVAGAELAELNPGLAAYFGVTDGVLVLNARDGTPAARAGLLAGDVIHQVNGVTVGSIPELRHAIQRADPGSAVRVRVLRRGQAHELELARE